MALLEALSTMTISKATAGKSWATTDSSVSSISGPRFCVHTMTEARNPSDEDHALARTWPGSVRTTFRAPSEGHASPRRRSASGQDERPQQAPGVLEGPARVPVESPDRVDCATPALGQLVRASLASSRHSSSVFQGGVEKSADGGAAAGRGRPGQAPRPPCPHEKTIGLDLGVTRVQIGQDDYGDPSETNGMRARGTVMGAASSTS